MGDELRRARKVLEDATPGPWASVGGHVLTSDWATAEEVTEITRDPLPCDADAIALFGSVRDEVWAVLERATGVLDRDGEPLAPCDASVLEVDGEDARWGVCYACGRDTDIEGWEPEEDGYPTIRHADDCPVPVLEAALRAHLPPAGEASHE